MYPKQLQWFYNSIDAIFSIFRLLWRTRFKKTKKIETTHSKCLILGNGPSLTSALENSKDVIGNYDLIAINFMGTTPLFSELKPSVYILCDPAFWFDVADETQKKKVSDFYLHLSDTITWNVQLYLPWQASKQKNIAQTLSKNQNIELCYYNKTNFEGFRFLKKCVYRKQLGMPRAQNVLIAALMLAIYSSYDEIYLAGSENDWLKNLWVDDQNRLRINDIHFYDQKESSEKARVMQLDLITMLAYLYYMFKGYKEIRAFADTTKSKIYNSTPDTFIDAFERKPLS